MRANSSDELGGMSVNPPFSWCGLWTKSRWDCCSGDGPDELFAVELEIRVEEVGLDWD